MGFRAAWLLSTDALRQHKFEDAVRLVQGQPRLASNVAGKELLARVAVAAKPPGRRRQGVRGHRRRFRRGQDLSGPPRVCPQGLDRCARRYTEELMAMLPDQLQLRANLDLIAKAEHAGS